MRGLILALILCSGLSFAGERIAPEYETDRVLADIIWYDSLRELRKKAHELGYENASKLGAFSRCMHNEEDGYAHCLIHIVRPRRNNDAYVTDLGHEILHGLWGSFHTGSELK